MSETTARVNLTKTETIVVLAKCCGKEFDDATDVSSVYFAAPDSESETGYCYPGIGLTYDTWQEMGFPQSLTLTIQPGNLLNGGN